MSASLTARVVALTPLGDWTLLAWLVTAGYLVSAWMCWRARRFDCAAPASASRNARRAMWIVMALGLAVLGLNKQLDVHTIVQRAGKHIVEVQGWYEHRQSIKLAVAAAAGLCAVTIVSAGVIVGRRSCRHGKLALAGCVVLAAYVALRAAIFQRVDEAVGFAYELFDAAWLFELIGVGLIALAAWRHRAIAVPRLPHENSATP